MRSWSVPRRLGYALAVVVAACLSLPSAAQAKAGERILGYNVDLRIEPAGTLLVTERIDYDFGRAERHGIFRDVPVRFRYDDRYDRVYRADVLGVQGSPGTPAQFELSNEGNYLRIKIGDPDRTIRGRHGYTITYRITGALNGFEDHDELYWNAVGTQWPVPVDRASVRLAAPAAINRIACYAGPQGATTPCASSRADGRTASFGSAGLGPAQGLTVVAAFPAGAVPTPRPLLDERWSMARAFSATPATLGMAGGLAVLLVGGLGLLVAAGWQPARKARRRRASPATPAPPVGLTGGSSQVEPAPPDGLRPAQVGLLADKAVAPVAVSATIVDLAVRGYLRIEELPGDGSASRPKPRRGRKGPDWRLVKLKEPDRDLAAYERELVADLFRGRANASTHADGDEAGDGLASVKLSSLRRQFYKQFAELQRALYDDGTRLGWFAARPDRVRTGWLRIGVALTVVGAVATVALAAGTRAALVPVPVLLVGLALVIGARSMPSRTAAGRALARRIQRFRTYLTSPGLGTTGTDAADLFSPYLPYAIVLGLTQQWTLAFAGRDLQPQLGWYRGYGATSPYLNYHSFDSFSRSSERNLTSAPPSTSGGSSGSGFGGGGFSGGGGGGGGGGSW